MSPSGTQKSNGKAETVEATERAETDAEIALEEVTAVKDTVRELRQHIFELEEENEQLRQEIGRLRERLSELDSRTSILDLADDAEKLSAEQRRAILLVHLKRKAEQNDGKGAVNAEQWKEALNHPEFKRTTFHKDLSRTAEYIDCDGLSYEDGWLRLDLSKGELPQSELAKAEDDAVTNNHQEDRL